MKEKRSFNILTIPTFLLLIMMMVACGPTGEVAAVPASDAGGELRTISIGFSETSIDSLNPLDLEWRTPAYLLVWNLYDPLVRIDRWGIIEEAIAEDMEINRDIGYLKFKLRENMKFHDGTPLDAENVIASLESMIEPISNVLSTDYGVHIKEIETEGDYTIVINFDPDDDQNQVDSLLNILVQLPIFIENDEEHLFGTGPYKYDLDEWKNNTKLVLRPNLDYTKNEPIDYEQIKLLHFDEMSELNEAFQDGDIHVVWGNDSSDISELQALNDKPLIEVATTDLVFFDDMQDADSYLIELLDNQTTQNAVEVCLLVSVNGVEQFCSDTTGGETTLQDVYESIFSQYQTNFGQLYNTDHVEDWAVTDIGSRLDLDATIDSLTQNVTPELAASPQWNGFISQLRAVSDKNFMDLTGTSTQDVALWQHDHQMIIEQPRTGEVLASWAGFADQSFGEFSGIKEPLAKLSTNLVGTANENDDFKRAMNTIENLSGRDTGMALNIANDLDSLFDLVNLSKPTVLDSSVRNFGTLAPALPEESSVLTRFTVDGASFGLLPGAEDWQDELERIYDGPCPICEPQPSLGGPKPPGIGRRGVIVPSCGAYFHLSNPTDSRSRRHRHCPPPNSHPY